MPRQIRINADANRAFSRGLAGTSKALAMALLGALSSRSAENTPGNNAVSFSREIAPVLQQKCFTCHNPEKTKGQYQLHTHAALMKPGESGEPSVTPGEPSKSRLYQLLITRDADDRMPQKDDPLPSPQIALIERWIQQGAKCDGDPKATLASIIPRTKHPTPPERYPRAVPILALAFSPDGKELAASGYHEVTVWNFADGTLLRRIQDNPQQTQAIAYSPDGSLLAVCGGTPGRSGEVRVFENKPDPSPRVLATTTDFLLALAFSPDGGRLIAGGADNIIRVFNVTNGHEELRIEQHADWVVGLAFSPDGTHFASASRDKTARLYSAKTGELEETYDGHGEPVFGVAFSHDGKTVFTGGRDKEVHAWQAKDAKKLYEVKGFEADVLKLIVSSNLLFSASMDKRIRVHQLADKKAELLQTCSGHRDVVYSVALHEPLKRVAGGGFDGEIRVWGSEDGALITNFVAAPGFTKSN